MSAIEFLKSDHDRVKTLFKRYHLTRRLEKKKALAQELFHELEVHAKLDEEIVYPAIRRELGPEGESFVSTAQEDHQAVKTLLQELQGLDAADAGYRDKFQALKESVRRHVENEERIFPSVEEKLNVIELGAEMQERKMTLQKAQPFSGPLVSAAMPLAFITAAIGLGFLQRRLARRTRPGLARHSTSPPLSAIMTRDVETISPEAPVETVAERMAALNVGAIPVCDGRRLLGMLTDRDIVTRLVAKRRDLKSTTAQEAMSAVVIYCFEDDDVNHAAQLMEQQQVRRLPVLNRQKELVGIVSLGDIAVAGDRTLGGKALEGVSRA
jgi:CBS domain-containing protein/hemerythrin superfamily protein